MKSVIGSWTDEYQSVLNKVEKMDSSSGYTEQNIKAKIATQQTLIDVKKPAFLMTSTLLFVVLF